MNPITREESLLDGQDLTPITRKEKFIKRIYDKTQEVPTPVTREEWFLNKAGEGSGGDVTIEQLNVTENGTYSETGKAYSPVIVEVPAPTLITKSITENGTYNASEDNADGYSQVTVNVPYMEKKSASGDIASFSDGAGYPFLKVKANINPVQDLHGYDYPWVGGAGKNKLDPAIISQGTIDTAGGTTNCRTDYISVVGGQTYARSQGVAVQGFYARFYNSEKIEQDTSTRISNYSQYSSSFTVPSWAEYTKLQWYSNDGILVSQLVDNAQFEIGSSATSYAPYSNICPISGFTGVNVAVTGVNIWDEEWESGYYFTGSSGKVVKATSATTIRSKNPIPILPNTTYRIVGNVYKYFFTDEDANVISDGTNINITTPSKACYLYFYCENVSTYNNDISINYPSTDTSYHAYNGHVYPISWQDEAGIVYGGYIDLVSGVLTVTKAGIAEYNGETLPSAWISDRDRYVAGNTPTIGAQVVYDLATPQTYQLTPQQINTLIGQNNVWNNTNGQTEVEYFIPIE